MVMPRSWLRHMPKGLAEQPGWVFIGLLVFLVGVSYMTGFSQSYIQIVIGTIGLKMWGGFLALSGALTVYATIKAKPALEKLALRLLAFGLLAYAGWLLTLISFKQSALTVALCTILIVLAEIRIAFLKLMWSISTDLEKLEGEYGD